MCVSFSARPSTLGTRFHNYLYQELNLDFVYKAFAPNNIEHAILGLRALPIRGAGISMPFKEAVIPLIDSLDESAHSIQSVNTIVNTDGHLRGYNTDMQAVAKLLKENGVTSADRVAVVGSGGMAKACIAAAVSLGASGFLVARNSERGVALAESYGFSYTSTLESADVIINATPVGMAGGDDALHLPVSEAAVKSAKLMMDCVAVPAVTPLMNLAQSLGLRTVMGTAIMTLQALEQFVLYTGVRPSDDVVAAAAQFSREV